MLQNRMSQGTIIQVSDVAHGYSCFNDKLFLEIIGQTEKSRGS